MNAEHLPEVEREVEKGQIYTDTRSNDDVLYRVVYADDYRVLLRSNKILDRIGTRHYRCDKRGDFERYLTAGRYERRENEADAPSMPSEVEAEEQVWSDVSGVGEKTERKLYEAGIKTDHDLRSTDDEKVIDVYGMSEAKLERLYDSIE